MFVVLGRKQLPFPLMVFHLYGGGAFPTIIGPDTTIKCEVCWHSWKVNLHPVPKRQDCYSSNKLPLARLLLHSIKFCMYTVRRTWSKQPKKTWSPSTKENLVQTWPTKHFVVAHGDQTFIGRFDQLSPDQRFFGHFDQVFLGQNDQTIFGWAKFGQIDQVFPCQNDQTIFGWAKVGQIDQVFPCQNDQTIFGQEKLGQINQLFPCQNDQTIFGQEKLGQINQLFPCQNDQTIFGQEKLGQINQLFPCQNDQKIFGWAKVGQPQKVGWFQWQEGWPSFWG